jgi:hypothetical protein
VIGCRFSSAADDRGGPANQARVDAAAPKASAGNRARLQSNRPPGRSLLVMAPSASPVCITCGLAVGSGLQLNRMNNGQICPTCRDRVLDSIPPRCRDQ